MLYCCQKRLFYLLLNEYFCRLFYCCHVQEKVTDNGMQWNLVVLNLYLFLAMLCMIRLYYSSILYTDGLKQYTNSICCKYWKVLFVGSFFLDSPRTLHLSGLYLIHHLSSGSVVHEKDYFRQNLVFSQQVTSLLSSFR